VTDVRLPVDGATVSVSDGVLGMLEMLALDALAPHQHQYVETARRSGEALLLHRLNDVLDLSKAETTSVTLASEPFQPVDVVDEVVAALAPSARHKDSPWSSPARPPTRWSVTRAGCGRS
jgi:signal transduction histidine kinase